ncbi:MAG: type II toxin-antitoxin system RelE/ParE family toxin [Candidatus Peregrinibacteria bacterium]|nr:type II toxin-antitoxin system RelE/ParE family toxin [Candidatus Peregrinibacteria bacterium]MDZ4244844.1 type II toxin-antitoxin system RelE/ParE family toxin [Candidatus Gracilibacteria bacterium]
MIYKLIYSKRFTKDFSKLDSIVQSRILIALERLQTNPYENIKKLKDMENCAFRKRVGDYRIRFDIYDGTKQIYLYHVHHRKDVYKS